MQLDDRITAGFRKAVTRRTLLQRCLRFTLAAGTATALTMRWPSSAYASNCSYYGAVASWGCYCASTPECPGSICNDRGNVIAYHKRCDAWEQPNSRGQYCWCSQTCHHGGPYIGHYVCCDGYVQAGSGCRRSATPCICRWFILD